MIDDYRFRDDSDVYDRLLTIMLGGAPPFMLCTNAPPCLRLLSFPSLTCTR